MKGMNEQRREDDQQTVHKSLANENGKFLVNETLNRAITLNILPTR